MKKIISVFPILFLPLLFFIGCGTTGKKDTSISLIYAAMAICSFFLLVGYCYFIRKRNFWFLLLFSSVLIVNIGYFALAVSNTIETALFANRISYLGSVFLPFSMLMIILNVCKIPYKKQMPKILTAINFLIFLIAASPGYLPIYYKEVSLEIVNGVSILHKIYGPCHSLYYIYLFGYFSSMIFIILNSSAKNRLKSMGHAVILLVAVFVNIGVWFIEQFVQINFEILSVSYIISELFLLSLHLLLEENKHQKELLDSANAIAKAQSIQLQELTSHISCTPSSTATAESAKRFKRFSESVNTLTPTEYTIYNYYLEKKTTKEVLELLNIKENTLKFHNKNIYSKMEVSSRKELVAIAKEIQLLKQS